MTLSNFLNHTMIYGWTSLIPIKSFKPSVLSSCGILAKLIVPSLVSLHSSIHKYPLFIAKKSHGFCEVVLYPEVWSLSLNKKVFGKHFFQSRLNLSSNFLPYTEELMISFSYIQELSCWYFRERIQLIYDCRNSS